MTERRLARHLATYGNYRLLDDYLEIYEDAGAFQQSFAYFHQHLNEELTFMNLKARGGQFRHFNADNSRNLIRLIEELKELREVSKRAGSPVDLSPTYERVLADAEKWLEPSGGSEIPADFTPIDLEKYDPILSLSDATITLTGKSQVDLQLVGDGAYAVVHRFLDPDYESWFARKKLKSTVSQGDIERFRQEYDLMRSLRFPYILQVYKFNDVNNSYTMEYCESTLYKYIRRKNSEPTFDFAVRRRIALQFLYGLNFIHREGHFHRDLSVRNVLLKEFAAGAVIVKLSDFGLAKRAASQQTRTNSEIRGSIIDPSLGSFKEFAAVNDIYAAGFILSYIFTGRETLLSDSSALANLVHKCSHQNPALRYQHVLSIITDLEAI